MKTTADLAAQAPQKCCGCGACAAICPAECLTLKEDAEGFEYPVLNENACLECGACLRSCPALGAASRAAQPSAYAFSGDDREMRLHSTSGGCFALLAQQILSQGGAVYGAAFTPDWSVAHTRVTKREDLPAIMGSKYVQSRLEKTFSLVKNDLDDGKSVLFSGTPCQCAGLRSYLGAPAERLSLASLVCHGVPSPSVWRAYLDEMRGSRTISAVSFRDKDAASAQPWEKYGLKITFSDLSFIRNSLRDDAYLRGFLQNLTLRPSCAECAFKGISRDVDFTLGDFWGVRKCLPHAYDKDGVSLVFIHSEKALKLFDRLEGTKTPAPLSAVSFNPAITQSAAPSQYRKVFFAHLSAQDAPPVDVLLDSCTYRDHSAFTRLRRAISRLLGRTRRLRSGQ